MTHIIHPSAKIGNGTKFGEFVVIEADVRIGENCQVAHHVVIRQGTVIGNNVRIDEHTVIGKLPSQAALSALTRIKEPASPAVSADRQAGGLPPARVGDDTLIGAAVVIYRGSRLEPKVLVGDLASIREEVNIGLETIIGRGVTIENRTSVGARCKVQSEVYICALSSIGDGCFIAPEVTFTNDNFLGRTKERFKYHKGVTLLKGARIGANATILPGITIGEDGLVGAGSIVTEDVPARMVVLGTPARVVKKVPTEQLLENQ